MITSSFWVETEEENYVRSKNTAVNDTAKVRQHLEWIKNISKETGTDKLIRVCYLINENLC